MSKPKVNLVWTTPNGDNFIAHMARVSNPDNQNNTETAPRLISYLIRNKHWSPFEMVNACVEITTTRDVSRQILRHRSFSFQEFSQRYAEVPDEPTFSEAYTPHPTNRQLSAGVSTDPDLQDLWGRIQSDQWEAAMFRYRQALEAGVSKETARKLLPEGMTPTIMYMNGSLRSWIHYWDVRTKPDTQFDHRAVATQTREVVLRQYPQLRDALYNVTEIPGT